MKHGRDFWGRCLGTRDLEDHHAVDTDANGVDVAYFDKREIANNDSPESELESLEVKAVDKRCIELHGAAHFCDPLGGAVCVRDLVLVFLARQQLQLRHRRCFASTFECAGPDYDLTIVC